MTDPDRSLNTPERQRAEEILGLARDLTELLEFNIVHQVFVVLESLRDRLDRADFLALVTTLHSRVEDRYLQVINEVGIGGQLNGEQIALNATRNALGEYLNKIQKTNL